MNKMKVLQNHLMRWMSGKLLSDQISIERLCEMTRLPNIENALIKKKLVWFGHLKRSETPFNKSICKGRIPDIRRRGRPSWR